MVRAVNMKSAKKHCFVRVVTSRVRKTQQKRNQGVIIEVIYLKHKKQPKQHLSQDDDPAERTEISSVKHVSNDHDNQIRQYSTSPSPVIQRRINLRMISLSLSTLLYSKDDEVPHDATVAIHCNLYKNAKISMQSPYLNIEMISNMWLM